VEEGNNDMPAGLAPFTLGSVLALVAGLLALLIGLHVLAFTAPYVAAVLILLALARWC